MTLTLDTALTPGHEVTVGVSARDHPGRPLAADICNNTLMWLWMCV